MRHERWNEAGVFPRRAGKGIQWAMSILVNVKILELGG